MANIVDFKQIAQTAVDEVVQEMQKEVSREKLDEVVRIVDAVNMIEKIVKSTLKDMGMDPEQLGEEQIKEIAKNSARAAIKEGLKRLG